MSRLKASGSEDKQSFFQRVGALIKNGCVPAEAFSPQLPDLIEKLTSNYGVALKHVGLLTLYNPALTPSETVLLNASSYNFPDVGYKFKLDEQSGFLVQPMVLPMNSIKVSCWDFASLAGFHDILAHYKIQLDDDGLLKIGFNKDVSAVLSWDLSESGFSRIINLYGVAVTQPVMQGFSSGLALQEFQFEIFYEDVESTFMEHVCVQSQMDIHEIERDTTDEDELSGETNSILDQYSNYSSSASLVGVDVQILT